MLIKLQNPQSPEKSSETVKSETGFDREIPKGRYVSSKKRHWILNDQGLI